MGNVINLERNKRLAEREMERLHAGEDREACRKNFHAFLEERRDDPAYSVFITRYLEAERLAGQVFFAHGSRVQLGREDDYTFIRSGMAAVREEQEIKREILDLRMREILGREE